MINIIKPGDETPGEEQDFLEKGKSELAEELGEKKVKLEIAQNMGSIKFRNIIDEQGKKVGEIDVFSNNEFLGLSHIQINEKERGKGYGKAAYKEVVRIYGLPLQSLLSAPEADRIWNSLIKGGIAEIDKKGFRILSPEKLLSSDRKKMIIQRNAELRKSISARKQAKINNQKTGKPELEIAGNTWQFDKMEPGRTEIDENDVFKMTVQTGDYLQVNNEQIYTDEDKAKGLANLGDKKAVERTEIQAKDTLELGKEYVCKFSFKIPKDFPLLANRLVIGQWKQMTDVEGASQNPFLSQKLKRDKLVFMINKSGDMTGNTGSTTIAEVPIKKFIGERINVEYQFRFSEKEDGYLKIKMNGEKVTEYRGPLASGIKNPELRKNEVYFKFGLYRDNYDYGIKLLKKYDKNAKEKNENLEKEIADIEKAKEDEKNGKPMTIYFKEYSVEEIN